MSICETYTVARIEPLEGEELCAPSDAVTLLERVAYTGEFAIENLLRRIDRSGSTGVLADSNTNCPVVPETVGFIAAEFEITILVAVGLLCKGSNADKKGGSNCKKLFHTFFYLVN